MALSGEVYKGNKLAISIGGTLIEAPLVREVRISRTRDALDKTGVGPGDKVFLSGERSGTCAMTFWDSSKDADLIELVEFEEDDGEQAIVVYPRGNASGEKRISFAAMATGDDQGVEKNSVVPYTVNWQISGPITRDTVT